MQRQHEFVTVWHRAAEPLDYVAINVGRVALDSCRQVQHDLAFDSWLDYLHYRFANLNCEIRFSQSKTLWRILITNCRADKFALEFATNLGRTCCNLDNASFVKTKYNATLQRVDRVVKVHDCARRTNKTLICALEQLTATLHQDLNRHVFRNQILFDQQPHEVVIRLTR